jgi:hypothetical protein
VACWGRGGASTVVGCQARGQKRKEGEGRKMEEMKERKEKKKGRKEKKKRGIGKVTEKK